MRSILRSQPAGTRHIKKKISILASAYHLIFTQSMIASIYAPEGPRSREIETLHHLRQIGDVVLVVFSESSLIRKICPAARIFQIYDLPPQTPNPKNVLQVMPCHPPQRV
jgi:hypothetical protein